MPYDEPDLEDPTELIAVPIEVDGPEALHSMVACFAEELQGLGYDGSEIFRIFADPFYASAHGAFIALGPEKIREIVESLVGPVVMGGIGSMGVVPVRCDRDGVGMNESVSTTEFEV